MKKITFLFALTFITLGVFAQNLTLSYPGGVIPDGGSVIFETPAHVPINPGQKLIFVHNVGATDLNILCEKENIDTIPGTVNSFCWGLCYSPNVLISPSPVFIAAGDSSDESGFSGDYNAHGIVGDSQIKYTFFEMGNRDNKVSVIVTYRSTEDASVNNFSSISSKLNISPNPASNQVTIDYALSSANNTIVIKNLLGAVVATNDLSSTNGKTTVNTTDFIDGIYFVTITSNGTPVSSRKLIIKH